DINRRDAQRGKDIARHLAQGSPRPQRQRSDSDQNGERAAECSLNEVHCKVDGADSVKREILFLHSIPDSIWLIALPRIGFHSPSTGFRREYNKDAALSKDMKPAVWHEAGSVDPSHTSLSWRKATFASAAQTRSEPRHGQRSA